MVKCTVELKRWKVSTEINRLLRILIAISGSRIAAEDFLNLHNPSKRIREHIQPKNARAVLGFLPRELNLSVSQLRKDLKKLKQIIDFIYSNKRTDFLRTFKPTSFLEYFEQAYYYVFFSKQFLIAREMLKKFYLRPTPEKIKQLKEKDIIQAAESLGYPIYPLGDYEIIHKLALNLIGDKIAKLLSDVESKKPIYVIFGRDAEMLADVLLSVGADTNLAKRVKLINLSMGQMNKLKTFPQLVPNIQKFLDQNNLSKADLLDPSKNYVFIDAGYSGLLFNKVFLVQNIHPKEMESRFRGFLMFKITQSKSEELSWKKEPKSDFFTSFCNSFPAAKVWYGRLISDFHDTRVFDDSSRVNLALCNYLQIQPKFAPPAAVIEYVDGKLHSLCLPKYRVYPRKEGYEHAIENITHPVPHLYSGAIDPVVAFRLQLRTVEYFSKASVKRGF